MAQYDAAFFLRLGNQIQGKDDQAALSTQLRRFQALFGCDPIICSLLWTVVDPFNSTALTGKPNPRHMLWALLLMKVYGKEEELAMLAGGVDEKTFRTHAWEWIREIASCAAEVVSLT